MEQHINPLNAELNPICHLLELLGAHPVFHVSGIRVNMMHGPMNIKTFVYHLKMCPIQNASFTKKDKYDFTCSACILISQLAFHF